MDDKYGWKKYILASLVISVYAIVTKCSFDIPFDLLITKPIIEPHVGLVDVTMHALWNFKSNTCPKTKVIQEN